MNFKLSIFAIAVAMTLSGAAQAAVSAEEAAKLKTTLTPLGAERAGNADGSIPAWDGGYTEVPAGYISGDPRPDFFAGEKPLYSISSANMEQYTDKLTDGVKGLMKKYPNYRIDIYPTHRTVAAPQWVYDNTFKNATRAKLTGDGYRFEGAYGGIPFPITDNPNEMIINHLTMWKRGESSISPSRCYTVTPDGRMSMVSDGMQNMQSPYYYSDGSLDDYKGYYLKGHYVQSAPASKAGESIMAHDPSEAGKRVGLWQYLVGQRRVRRAPSVSYDTPDSVTSGMGFFDEAFMLFGPWDHHTYKLVGKQEIYVPYNNNKANAADPEKLFTPDFMNPDLVRWELHRVWVIEAELAPGKRHVVAKRKFYLDEDSWQILLMDGWDAQGDLWRMAYTLTLLAPDVPALIGNIAWGVYNLQTGGYYLNAAVNGTTQVKIMDRRPETFFSPEELANMGLR
ncbi:MAG: DUF1329 domain-containing protein [Candidatus Thiodiazotropha sp.]